MIEDTNVCGTIKFFDMQAKAFFRIDREELPYKKRNRIAMVLEEASQDDNNNNKTERRKLVNESKCRCTVTITPSAEFANKVDTLHQDVCNEEGNSSTTFQEQITQVFYCGGDAKASKDAGWGEFIVHCIGFPWKLIFAFVPPAHLLDGWLCFVVALGCIAIVTMLIGDMASLLGCSMGISKVITAITFVALGTSLPDTFASMCAAQSEEYADACIGNVTGSNSVNVFLGLGLPWTIGAIYWTSNGATEGWTEGYHEFLTELGTYDLSGKKAMFVVKAGTLGLSVAIFTFCALICIGFLYIRRVKFNGELGGEKKPARLSLIFCVSLWLIYIGASVYVESAKN